MQINLSQRGQLWPLLNLEVTTQGFGTQRGMGVTQGPCFIQHKLIHLPFDPISQLGTFVKPGWSPPVPSQSHTALRSGGQSSRSQENRKSLLSAGGWAATQSHHLCLSSAASSLPLCTPHSFSSSFTTSFHLFCRNIYRVQVRKQKLQLHPHHHRIYLQLGLCGAAR